MMMMNQGGKKSASSAESQTRAPFREGHYIRRYTPPRFSALRPEVFNICVVGTCNRGERGGRVKHRRPPAVLQKLGA